MIYETSFPGTENPISEGGAWHHTTNPWYKAKSVGGYACASTNNDGYNDNYAFLSGFGPDYSLETTLKLAGSFGSYAYEVEHILRASDTADYILCYEIDFYIDGAGASGKSLTIGASSWYWDGDSWSFLPVDPEPGYAFNGVLEVFDGDRFKSVISGTRVSVYYNETWACDFVFDQGAPYQHDTGQPGIGFFVRELPVAQAGWSHFKADDGQGGAAVIPERRIIYRGA